MSHWNYRIIKRGKKDDDDLYYCMCEVYYEDDKMVNWCDTMVSGESVEEIAETLKLMREALMKPVLMEKDFK